VGPDDIGGCDTYAVGPVTKPEAVFASRAEAEQAAADGDGKFIQWDGHTGHQCTAPDPDAEAWMDRELEAG
jgi:hypothetical protein